MRLPHPVTQLQSAIADTVIGWQSRELVFLAFEMLLRVDVLLLASLFLETKDWQDPRLRDRLLNPYRRNTLGDWREWLTWHLQTAPLGAEVVELKRWNRDRREAISALLALRNRSAHGVDRTDATQINASALQAIDLFTEIVRGHPGLGEFETVNGTRVHLVTDSKPHQCSPLLLSVSSEPVNLLLYDRTSQEGLHYIRMGFTGEVVQTEALAELHIALYTKTASFEVLHERTSWPAVQGRLHILNDQARSRLRLAGKFKPESSVRRQGLDMILEAFLRDRPRLLILEGTRGSGKSTWCCLATLDREARDCPVLLISGEEAADVPFPRGVERALGLDGHFESFALRQAEMSKDGRFVLFVENADPLVTNSASIISCMKWTESLGDLPIKIIVASSSRAMATLRTSHSTWLNGISLRVATVPSMEQGELLEMAEALEAPAGIEGTRLRALRTEYVSTLIRLMGGTLRPWLARLFLENAGSLAHMPDMNAFDLYQQLYVDEAFNKGDRARIRILRELAIYLYRHEQSELSMDEYSSSSQVLLALFDTNPNAINVLIQDGVLIEGTRGLNRSLSFADGHFRDFLASFGLSLPQTSAGLAVLLRERIAEGASLTSWIFALLRYAKEDGHACSALFEAIEDKAIKLALLKEVAYYDDKTFSTWLGMFYRSDSDSALKIAETLLRDEQPHLAAQAARHLLSLSDEQNTKRVHLLLALCKFGMDDYEGAKDELAIGKVPTSLRVLTLLGDIEVAQGALERGRAHYLEALDCAVIDYAEGRAHALRGLGYIQYRLKDLNGARVTLEEACRENAAFGDTVNSAESFGDLGETLCAMGLFEESRRQLDLNRSMNQRLGRVGGVGIVEGLLAIVDWKEGDIAGAERRLISALGMVRHASYRWREAWLTQRLGELLLSQGRRLDGEHYLLRSGQLLALLKVEHENS